MNGDEKGATQMRDYFNEMFEWDGNVPRKKKKQVLPDGARANFKMQMMDHAGDFIPIFADGTPDHTSPHRPGHRFADVNDEARLVANDAYEERRQRLHYANKRGRQRRCVRRSPPAHGECVAQSLTSIIGGLP
jgi:hypothetical protein